MQKAPHRGGKLDKLKRKNVCNFFQTDAKTRVHIIVKNIKGAVTVLVHLSTERAVGFHAELHSKRWRVQNVRALCDHRPVFIKIIRSVHRPTGCLAGRGEAVCVCVRGEEMGGGGGGGG